MNDTGRELLLLFSLGGFCVIKYILENLLNYPLTSSSTSWYRIILKLHTYCSIIQTADFVICHFDFFSHTKFTNTNTETTLSNNQWRGTVGGGYLKRTTFSCWEIAGWLYQCVKGKISQERDGCINPKNHFLFLFT